MTATDTALFVRWPNLPLILEFLEFSAVQNIQCIIFIILLPEQTNNYSKVPIQHQFSLKTPGRQE